VVDLLGGLVDRERRGRPAVGDAGAQLVGHVAEVLRDSVDLRDHRLGDVRVRDRELRHPDGDRRLLAEDRIDPELGQAGFENLGVAPAVEDQHLAGDPVLVGEAVRGDRLGPVGEGAPLPRLLVLAGPASRRRTGPRTGNCP
jgi:hypothetical protein